MKDRVERSRGMDSLIVNVYLRLTVRLVGLVNSPLKISYPNIVEESRLI